MSPDSAPAPGRVAVITGGAAAVAHLASDAAAMTGQVLCADGGPILR